MQLLLFKQHRYFPAVEAGSVEAIVAYDLDRLTRQPKELEYLIDLAENSLQLHVVTGVLPDLASGHGRLVAGC